MDNLIFITILVLVGEYLALCFLLGSTIYESYRNYKFRRIIKRLENELRKTRESRHA